LRARAYGVAVTALQVAQGAVLLLSGALSDPLGPSKAIAVLAAGAIALLGIELVRRDHFLKDLGVSVEAPTDERVRGA
jgi:hypothetical protein